MELNQIPKVVDENQAAEIIGKKVQTLRNYRHIRKGPPYIKDGRSVRYFVDDLIEYLKSKRIVPERGR